MQHANRTPNQGQDRTRPRIHDVRHGPTLGRGSPGAQDAPVVAGGLVTEHKSRGGLLPSARPIGVTRRSHRPGRRRRLASWKQGTKKDRRAPGRACGMLETRAGFGDLGGSKNKSITQIENPDPSRRNDGVQQSESDAVLPDRVRLVLAVLGPGGAPREWMVRPERAGRFPDQPLQPCRLGSLHRGLRRHLPGRRQEPGSAPWPGAAWTSGSGSSGTSPSSCSSRS